MRRVDYMIGPKDFATLKAEQFMQDVVSYYQVEETGDKRLGRSLKAVLGASPF